MINELFNYVKMRKEHVKAFKNNIEYLKVGSYKFDETRNYIYCIDAKDEKNQVIKESLNNTMGVIHVKNRGYTNYKSKIKKIIDFMLIFFYGNNFKVKEKNNTKTSGTILLFKNKNDKINSLKIFDTINNKVITLFTDTSEYKKIKEKIEYDFNDFLIPKIIKTDNEKKIISEELIYTKEFSQWSAEEHNVFLKKILREYKKKYQEIKYRKDYEIISIAELIDKTNNKSIKKISEIYLDLDFLSSKIPLLLQHGDLWGSNILKDRFTEKIYIIDFEHMNYYYFLYDLFSMICLNFINLNIYDYLNMYKSNHFNECFSEIFDIFNLKFNPDDKRDYLALFVIFFLNYRFSINNYTEEQENKIINNFTNILKKESFNN